MARLELFSEPTEWQAAMHSCQCVVHLAARVHDMRADAQVQSEYDHINVDGSRFVAEQAQKANVQRLLFLSSIKVNGEGAGRPYQSGDLPDPKDAYGRSKWAAEQSLRELCARRGMGLVVIRPPLVYGPGVKANFRRLMRLAGLGIPLPIASIANRRSFIGVSNLVDFIEICLTHSAASTDTWLVSDGEDLSTPDLLNRLSALMGRPLRMFGIPPVWLRRLARPLALSGMVDRLERYASSRLLRGAAEARVETALYRGRGIGTNRCRYPRRANQMSLVETSILLATFCASLLGSRVVWRYALQSKLLDVPNIRSSHAVPTPRGGGLAIALAFFAGTSALLLLGLLDRKVMLALAGGGAIAWVGFLDDHHQVSARWRFGVHLAAAIFVVAVLGAIRLGPFPWFGSG